MEYAFTKDGAEYEAMFNGKELSGEFANFSYGETENGDFHYSVIRDGKWVEGYLEPKEVQILQDSNLSEEQLDAKIKTAIMDNALQAAYDKGQLKRVPVISYETSDGKAGEFTREQSEALMTNAFQMVINKADNLYYNAPETNSLIHAKVLERVITKNAELGFSPSPEDIRKDISAIYLTDKDVQNAFNNDLKEAKKQKIKYNVAKGIVVGGQTMIALMPLVSEFAMLAQAYNQAHSQTADVPETVEVPKNDDLKEEATPKLKIVEETVEETVETTSVENNLKEVQAAERQAKLELDEDLNTKRNKGIQEINDKYDKNANDIKDGAKNARSGALDDYNRGG
jgi:hypothetical protein